MQGLDLDTYVKYMGGDKAAFRDSFKEQAEKQVKVRLALEKIAQLESITPSEEEINAEYQKYADEYKMELEQVKAAIPESELVKDLAVSKAMTFVRENAEIAEVDAPSEKKTAAKKSAAKKTVAAKTEDGDKKPAAKKTTTAKKTTSAAKKPASTAKKTTAKKDAE